MTENVQAGAPSERTALATGWFARLADSIDRGQFAAAGTAQKELSRLGFVVTLRTPRPRPKPRGQGGGR